MVRCGANGRWLRNDEDAAARVSVRRRWLCSPPLARGCACAFLCSAEDAARRISASPRLASFRHRRARFCASRAQGRSSPARRGVARELLAACMGSVCVDAAADSCAVHRPSSVATRIALQKRPTRRRSAPLLLQRRRPPLLCHPLPRIALHSLHALQPARAPWGNLNARARGSGRPHRSPTPPRRVCVCADRFPLPSPAIGSIARPFSRIVSCPFAVVRARCPSLRWSPLLSSPLPFCARVADVVLQNRAAARCCAHCVDELQHRQTPNSHCSSGSHPPKCHRTAHTADAQAVPRRRPPCSPPRAGFTSTRQGSRARAIVRGTTRHDKRRR